MARGKVISFDEFRGFGFIAPDEGGEDVFMHVNDLDSDKRLISVDAQVEFMVESGGKGLKASHVRVLDRPSAPKVTLVPPPLPSPTPKLTPAPTPTPTPATIAAMVSPGPVVATPDRQANDAGFCDVLSVKEFTREITEAVLAAVPTMTAQQILGVRECLVGLAQTHSWVDG
ncbi:cold-shock protein [Acrocarpospora catenulata]|uniref:cold-shock protein n=1 Tax=Acrocarpospora catenulata TaxID=2836182 RepID=UPI001BD96D49|nr:cold shock domain-containing protein [Acrocarpospora catenulata]